MIEVSPCCGQGDFLCTVLGVLPGRWAKKRGWTIQHRPTSNPSKALPDSPGRAARKPAGKKLSVLAGLNASASGRFMAGVAQRNKIPGLASLLGTRKTRFQQNSTSEKN
jgi:hypothetical protein